MSITFNLTNLKTPEARQAFDKWLDKGHLKPEEWQALKADGVIKKVPKPKRYR